MTDDEIILELQQRRDLMLQELARVEAALAALGGEDGQRPTLTLGRRLQVGDDKLAVIRAFLEQHSTKRDPWVRQSDITREARLDGQPLNSGTVSTGLNLLKQQGKVEEGPKKDRSKTWRLVA